MRKFLLTLLLAAACAPAAFAQVSPEDRDKVNVFVGFSHNHVDTGTDDLGLNNVIEEREGFNGVNGSITGNVSRYVGLKFDYSFHRRDLEFPVAGTTLEARAKLHNFLGGVQFKDNTKDSDKRLRPFGHVLVGAHNSSIEVDPVVCAQVIGAPCPNDLNDDETGFAAAVGGGLDVRLNDRISVRAIQLDWNPNRFGDDGGSGSRTAHNFRIGIGIVFH
jgi:opacity protein-like surface antigen